MRYNDGDGITSITLRTPCAVFNTDPAVNFISDVVRFGFFRELRNWYDVNEPVSSTLPCEEKA